MATNQHQIQRERSDVISIGLPYEAALVATAMALMTLLAPHNPSAASHLHDAMLLGFGGFLLFFVSKVSLFASGRWSTWGTKPMRTPFKAAYVLGYLLMAISSISVVAIL